jgi:hypothetical protein
VPSVAQIIKKGGNPMVQDVNVSNLFFAEKPESNLIQKRNSENGDDSYEAVAKQKTAEVKKSGKESTVTGDTTSPAPRTVKTKVDKPKVGNKDAFFPSPAQHQIV